MSEAGRDGGVGMRVIGGSESVEGGSGCTSGGDVGSHVAVTW